MATVGQSRGRAGHWGAPTRARVVVVHTALPVVAVALCAVFGSVVRAQQAALPEIVVEGIGPVPTETDYVPHVVACENGAASFEALKVQAVAARTFAYFRMQTGGSIRDGASDQVYTCPWQPTQAVFDAVAATERQILTYQGDVIAAFFVAGAIPSDPTGRARVPPDLDPTGTERFVTYPLLDGLLGPDNLGSPLGLRGNPRNRGAMSQNGSDFLSDAGAVYTDILPFYYGADIVLEKAVPAIGTPPGPVVLDELFDYADQAALEAIWNDQPGAAGTLDKNLGFASPSLDHPGGTTSNRTFPATVPTDALPLIWEFDFYDDGSGNKRITGGLRDDGDGAQLTAIVEMGRYNALTDPESGSTVSGYGIRTVSVGGEPGNWITFAGSPAVGSGWHHFKATIGASRILFELDLGRNGTIDAARDIATASGDGIAYNVARFGGPSNLSSPGGGAHFDNLRIALLATRGDMDLDGDVDFDDIGDFVLGLNDPQLYESTYATPPATNGDTDGDGDIDFDDIDDFVLLLTTGTARGDRLHRVPEPTGMVLTLLTIFGLAVTGTRGSGSA